MKRYLLFAYDIYYPGGGQGDVVGDYETIEEVKKYINDEKISTSRYTHDYYDVLDMQKRKWLEEEEYL